MNWASKSVWGASENNFGSNDKPGGTGIIAFVNTT